MCPLLTNLAQDSFNFHPSSSCTSWNNTESFKKLTMPRTKFMCLRRSALSHEVCASCCSVRPFFSSVNRRREYAKRKNVCLICLLINDPTDVKRLNLTPPQQQTYYYVVLFIAKNYNDFESFVDYHILSFLPYDQIYGQTIKGLNCINLIILEISTLIELLGHDIITRCDYIAVFVFILVLL